MGTALFRIETGAEWGNRDCERQGMSAMGGKKEKQGAPKGISKPLLARALILLAVCGIVAFGALAIKLFKIQISDNDYYEAGALGNQLRETLISATRGTIYDRNGKILAMSASVENVFISPYDIERFEQDAELIARGLSEILGIDYNMVMERTARTYSQYEVVKPKVESLEAQVVRNYIKENKIKGVYLEPTAKRYYPNNSLASQIIGFVGTGEKGLDGLEQRYDDLLTGVSGREVSLTNARGTDLMFNEYEDRYDALDGNDITLTIDSSIQYYVEKHLEQAIQDYDIVNGAMCIAMNPKTGAILALANYPNYDPGDFLSIGEREAEKLSGIDDEEEYSKALRDAQYLQWRNRALADTYEPGSVFKILTLAMALEENLASPDSVFNCHGSTMVSGRTDPLYCWRRYGHGQQTLFQAVQNSCNMMCVELGMKMGAETFYKYVDAFGLFEKTGLDSAVEGSGIWWNDSVFFNKSNQSQLASATFGQTFKVTPIQMITAVSAVINGGYLMRPYMVEEVKDCNGNIVSITSPTVVRQVVSSETSATMREMLEGVVSVGTGINAQVKGYSVGGKTGTSENTEQIAASGDGGSSGKDYIVSFLGFAPADDPEIIILLLLDTPSRDTKIYISGGSMAAPVVGNMLADILPLCLGIAPSYTEEDLKDINVYAPRVMGKTLEEAISILTGQGFEYKVIGSGDKATGQLPAPNAYIASGTKIIIYAGEDVPRDAVIVPQLYNMTYAAAKQALESRGLFIRTAGVAKSNSRVRVSVQSIPEGKETAYGSVIEVTLIDKDVIELRN